MRDREREREKERERKPLLPLSRRPVTHSMGRVTLGRVTLGHVTGTEDRMRERRQGRERVRERESGSE